LQSLKESQSSFTFTRARCKGMIYLRKEIQKKQAKSLDITPQLSQLQKLKSLTNYPTSPEQLRGVHICSKAKILKAHLSEAFPKTKFSVRCDFFSGGKLIQINILKGQSPTGIEKINELYAEKTIHNGIESYERYVEVIDKRSEIDN
jgi:hypothetical protein